MRWPDDERLYMALVVVIMLVAGLVYLSSLPRDPVHGALTPQAQALPGLAPRARPATPPKAVADVNLQVTVWPRGPGGPRLRWNITCPPASAPCRTAISRRALLMREPAGPCSGRSGRAEALVVGRVAGRHVVAWLDQRDGCGARRWRALLPLVGVRPPPADGGKSARS